MLHPTSSFALLLILNVFLSACAIEDSVDSEPDCEGGKCDVIGNREDGASCSWDWQCKGDDGLKCISGVCSRCPEGLSLRSLWQTFASYDEYTVEGRTSRYTDAEQIQITGGPDGWLYNEYDWVPSDWEPGDSDEGKIRNPEYDSLADELVFSGSDSDIPIAAFNLLQDLFDTLGPRGNQNADIEVSVVNAFVSNATDDELVGEFSQELSATLNTYESIIADGAKADASETDKRWAESYTQRKEDLRCFAERSLGIPWTWGD